MERGWVRRDVPEDGPACSSRLVLLPRALMSSAPPVFHKPLLEAHTELTDRGQATEGRASRADVSRSLCLTSLA